MKLLFDIGNTTISAVIMKEEKVLSRGQVLTKQKKSVLREDVQQLVCRVGKRVKNIDGIRVCSVVPEATQVVDTVVRRHLQKPLLIVGRDLTVPIKNLYGKPEQVGQDRLVCAYAAKEIYGAPAIVVDLGTAITLDVVSVKGAYLGGMIIPGLRLSAEALFQKTALLPLTEIQRPRGMIGKDTKESILSGLFYGYGAMLSGVVQELSRPLKKPVAVIMTGGYADIMKSFLKIENYTIDRDLIFKGMERLEEQRA